jgi:phage shock protein PspC (stress-responsive transcriptional regulator)
VFSRMARTFLPHIRVSSKAELVEGTIKGLAEVRNWDNAILHLLSAC